MGQPSNSVPSNEGFSAWSCQISEHRGGPPGRGSRRPASCPQGHIPHLGPRCTTMHLPQTPASPVMVRHGCSFLSLDLGTSATGGLSQWFPRGCVYWGPGRKYTTTSVFLFISSSINILYWVFYNAAKT